jgi:hypothetical protein
VGRACWAINGTFFDGKIHGDFASKMTACVDCEFYRIVVYEEGLNYQGAKEILDGLKNEIIDQLK